VHWFVDITHNIIKKIHIYMKKKKKETIQGWVGGSQKRATSTRAGPQELLRLLVADPLQNWTNQGLDPPVFRRFRIANPKVLSYVYVTGHPRSKLLSN